MICPNCKFETNDNACPVCGFQFVNNSNQVTNNPQNQRFNDSNPQAKVYSYGHLPVSPVQQFPPQQKKKPGKGVIIAIIAAVIAVIIIVVAVLAAIGSSHSDSDSETKTKSGSSGSFSSQIEADPAELIAGNWKGSLDFTDYFNKALKNDDEMKVIYDNGFSLKNITIDVVFCFSSEGKLQVMFFDSAKQKFNQTMTDQLVDALYSIYSSKLTKDEIREEFEDIDYLEDLDDYDVYYQVKNNNIYINETAGDFENCTDYISYKFKNNNNTLELNYCSFDSDESIFGSMPIDLIRM